MEKELNRKKGNAFHTCGMPLSCCIYLSVYMSLPLNYEFYEVGNELYLYYTHPPFRGNEEKGKKTCR